MDSSSNSPANLPSPQPPRQAIQWVTFAVVTLNLGIAAFYLFGAGCSGENNSAGPKGATNAVSPAAPPPAAPTEKPAAPPTPPAKPAAVTPAPPAPQSTPPAANPPAAAPAVPVPTPAAAPVAVPVPAAATAAPALPAVPKEVRDRVTGFVFLKGTPAPEREITAIRADPKCGALQPGPVFSRNYVVGTNSGLANVFIRLIPEAAGPALPTGGKTEPVLMDQVGCLYEPYMAGVKVGAPLVIRNSDSMMHNVNCTSKAGNPTFNIAQARQGQEDTKSFTKPELFVTLQCNVHPWMFAYVGVVEHAYFAVTDRNGYFELPAGLSAGRYTLEATHRKAGTLTQPVEVTAAGVVPTRLELTAK